MRADDTACLDVYWDNWLCKKQRDQVMGKPKGDAHFFKLIQDVPRGGPHPRTSTTLPPAGGVAQLRFGGGFCPDVGGLFGERVVEPSLSLTGSLT